VSEPLYSLDILRLAAATAEAPRLADPDGSAERSSRTCGSRIVVDVALDEAGRVAAYGHVVNACALGQASAALLARNVHGLDRANLVQVRDDVADYLTGTSEHLPEWTGIDALARARPYRARHPAILLPFEAAVDAVERAAQ
jgi:NifU-like protein involved in Fe-S cluster formation